MQQATSSTENTVGLLAGFSGHYPEAGCDEAGRGCLAGPVTAAAVILPRGLLIPGLNDSKKLNAEKRTELRKVIIEECVDWAVAAIANDIIDEINILQASILAMQKALEGLTTSPAYLLIDGIHFRSYKDIPYSCIPKADSLYANVAAASILAKTNRDDYMKSLHLEYPAYGWDSNKGYPTPTHKEAIARYGLTPFHRRSFNHGKQMRMNLE